ncbi:YciI family protein [Nocardioides mangrovi]|uniref:YciI family protein n=1 Tax=Nocardioides mangrovi TaxID=2874580 RepID=A0ABS7UAT1_9ACTN|nr:YciI family protein [Nocardioides mangrovi]MBZ5738108.1 YciI family protein [Nocardioides mangrovi]
MTQYLLSVHSGPDDYSRSLEEMQPAFEAVDRFNTKAQDAGIWVFAGGLQPGDTASTVDATGDQPVLADGPYLDTKEWLGGFWVFELPDRDAAIAWATEASAACGGTVEVRPFQEEPA